MLRDLDKKWYIMSYSFIITSMMLFAYDQRESILSYLNSNKPKINIVSHENYNPSETIKINEKEYIEERVIIEPEEPKEEKIIDSLEVKEKPYINIRDLENRIHYLINIERENIGLRSLEYDTKLVEIARKHSKDMDENKFFDHRNLKGQNATDRGKEMGYVCRKDYGTYYSYGLAENIFQNNLADSIIHHKNVDYYNWNTLEGIAQETVKGWMNSPGHRKNILTPTFDKEGIGISISPDGRVLITQDFC